MKLRKVGIIGTKRYTSSNTIPLKPAIAII